MESLGFGCICGGTSTGSLMEGGADGNNESYFITSTELPWKYFHQRTNPLEFLPRKLRGSDESFDSFHERFQQFFYCFHGNFHERDGIIHGTRKSSRYFRGRFHQYRGVAGPKSASIAASSAPFDFRPLQWKTKNRCRLFRSLTPPPATAHTGT